MRLTIHRFHILKGLILPTKQQTRLDGTFHILPSLLRLTGLQTHVMARAYHIVHRRGEGVDLSFTVLRLVIHGRQGEWRWCWGGLLHHVIQFFHHVSHRGSGVFHHLAYDRITVLGRHHILFLLLLLPRRVYALGRFSLPIGITHWRHIDGHPAQGCFSPPTTYCFIPWTLGSHWSAYPTHIRTSHVPIGQLVMTL